MMLEVVIGLHFGDFARARCLGRASVKVRWYNGRGSRAMIRPEAKFAVLEMKSGDRRNGGQDDSAVRSTSEVGLRSARSPYYATKIPGSRALVKGAIAVGFD